MWLILHLLAAFAWGVIVQFPWDGWAFYALGALVIIHLLAPFWFHVSSQPPLHRAFLFGPFMLAGIDAIFLGWALRDALWGDITFIIVTILAAGGALLLLYSLLVMTLLDRWRANRERRRADRSGNDGGAR